MTGDKIAFYRSIKRYTQDYMANKLGISQKSYCNIENNTKRPTEIQLDIIADELGITKETIKSSLPIVIINDFQFNEYLKVNPNEGLQTNLDKELLKNILYQISQKDEIICKKDELIEKLHIRVDQLFQKLAL